MLTYCIFCWVAGLHRYFFNPELSNLATKQKLWLVLITPVLFPFLVFDYFFNTKK